MWSSPGVVLYAALFSFFVADYLCFEEVHLYTYDFVAERVGFKLGWGCLAFYPFFYPVGLWSAARLPDPGAPRWLLVLAAGVFCCGWVLSRGANLQKFSFKTRPARRFLGVLEPKAIASGEHRLLYGGFWGLARHINYLGETGHGDRPHPRAWAAAGSVALALSALLRRVPGTPPGTTTTGAARRNTASSGMSTADSSPIGSFPGSTELDFARRYGPSALVAGASEGIGAAFARELARRGLDLVLVARRPEPLTELAREIAAFAPVQVRCLSLDLARADAAAELLRETAAQDVGLVVYNAALAPGGAFLDIPLAQQLAALDVNTRGPLALAHGFGQRMAARGHGGLVLLSSLTAFQGSPFVTTYGATKSFLLSLAEGLWYELAPPVSTCCACSPARPARRATCASARRAARRASSSRSRWRAQALAKLGARLDDPGPLQPLRVAAPAARAAAPRGHPADGRADAAHVTGALSTSKRSPLGYASLRAPLLSPSAAPRRRPRAARRSRAPARRCGSSPGRSSRARLPVPTPDCPRGARAGLRRAPPAPRCRARARRTTAAAAGAATTKDHTVPRPETVVQPGFDVRRVRAQRPRREDQPAASARSAGCAARPRGSPRRTAPRPRRSGGSRGPASLACSAMPSAAGSRAEVGTPSPPVTRQLAASFTWDVEVPRSWRTPSRIRLKPCT